MLVKMFYNRKYPAEECKTKQKIAHSINLDYNIFANEFNRTIYH